MSTPTHRYVGVTDTVTSGVANARSVYRPVPDLPLPSPQDPTKPHWPYWQSVPWWQHLLAAVLPASLLQGRYWVRRARGGRWTPRYSRALQGDPWTMIWEERPNCPGARGSETYNRTQDAVWACHRRPNGTVACFCEVWTRYIGP